HVGGGPAEYDRDGRALAQLTPDADNVETAIHDPETGELVAWDWSESGTVEMNCFLCHLETPDNAARIETLQAGDFGWANTATLVSSGIVTRDGDEWTWNAAAFQENGELAGEFVTVQDPSNDNCGLCHGMTHNDPNKVLTAPEYTAENWETLTTGQIVSPQRIANSGMNLADKDVLTRSWDVHSERVVACVDCHFSLNNPVLAVDRGDQPEHLIFDPRRLGFGDYLYQPLHQFARGESAQDNVAPELRGTMRRCESCHSIENTHDWLPYKDRHVDAVSCESCHIPQMYAPAYQEVDWTVAYADGEPRISYRGIEGDNPSSVNVLVTGYQPVVLQRTDVDGNKSLAPYNLITAWYWVYGDPARPVSQVDLQAAWLDGDTYKPEIVEALDANRDGILTEDELFILEIRDHVVLIQEQLQALGLEDPRIVGEVQPYSINHNVTTAEWATRDCQACHSENSRLTQPIALSAYTPGGVLPEFVSNVNTNIGGDVVQDENGMLYYQPDPAADGLYVIGHNNVTWVDWLGILFFLGVLGGVSVHGGLRYYFAKRQQHAVEPELEKVYMYGVYERLWHWLQTTVILLLIFTGLIIHKPDMFGMFSFRYVVLLHNILGFILVANAFLSLFYHLASGEIRQYIPQPRGFFDQAITQAKFYVGGIFRKEEHPFEKTRERKLNPLQRITYFGILNVLLPLQVLTGILMWGAQRWPDISAALGGLPFLGPFHSLVAWLFAAFIVAHVYLTTTGHKPLTSMKAMIDGWDEVEIAPPAQSQERVPSELDPDAGDLTQEASE
ncbi:MAG: cytochrome b/b6 domain-containing protein, partial [Anaerolineales bacterium]|nr:cytochrome b/b6 domain-containing protein [Anaerolineales bacterium]